MRHAFAFDAQSAESKRNAAGRRVCIERRSIERLRPIRFRRLDADGAFAVFHCMFKGNVLAHRRVVVAYRFQKSGRIDTLQLRRQFLKGIGALLGHELDAVLGPQMILDLGIEHLPRKLPRLLQELPAIFGVGE